jgi:hypothetical protein
MHFSGPFEKFSSVTMKTFTVQFQSETDPVPKPEIRLFIEVRKEGAETFAAVRTITAERKIAPALPVQSITVESESFIVPDLFQPVRLNISHDDISVQVITAQNNLSTGIDHHHRKRPFTGAIQISHPISFEHR